MSFSPIFFCIFIVVCVRVRVHVRVRVDVCIHACIRIYVCVQHVCVCVCCLFYNYASDFNLYIYNTYIWLFLYRTLLLMK